MDQIPDIKNVKYNEFARRVFAYEPVYYSTVPIAGSKDGKSILDRTGVLFRVANIPFLITAQHGIPSILDAGYRLFIPPDKPSGRMVAFGYRNLWLSTREGTDCAIFEFDQQTADVVKEEGYRFIGMRDVTSLRSMRSPRTSYLVAGFPTVLEDGDEEGRKRCDYYPWLTCSWNPWVGYPRDLPPEFKFDVATHLLLSYEKEARHTSGMRGVSPSPKGMSGCGVWFVRDWDSPIVWNPDQIRLVAIQASWFDKRRCLKALWIDEVLAMIWKRYSDSRNPMRIAGFEF